MPLHETLVFNLAAPLGAATDRRRGQPSAAHGEPTRPGHQAVLCRQLGQQAGAGRDSSPAS